MAHEPPLVRTAEINALCMEIAELVGALGSASALSTSPVLHRELRITSSRWTTPAAPTGSWTIWTHSPPTTCCAPTAS